MTVTYQREEFANVRDEIMPLCERHWEEVALNKDTIPLSPNWDMYQSLDDAKIMHVFTLRDDKLLVGYFFILVINHLHYQEHLFANSDIIYIDKEYRKGLLAFNFIRFAEREIKDLGVSVMMMNTKIHKPLDKLFLRLGYAPIERIYSKNLGIE